MSAQNCLDILDRLANGQISPQRAVSLIEKLKDQEMKQSQNLHRRFFSCVTIRVRPEDKFGLYLKIPIGLANLFLSLAWLSPKLRQKFKSQGISLREVQSLIRFLKYKESGFDIRVEANDGTKIVVNN